MQVKNTPAMLRRLRQRERLGLLTVGETLTGVKEAAAYMGYYVRSLPDPVREMLDLDRLEGSRTQELLHATFAGLSIGEPSVSEAARALSLGHAQAIVRGTASPRDGAWGVVEILYEAEDLGVADAVLADLVDFHRLLTLRDDADEVSRESTGARATEFAEYAHKHDAQIVVAAQELLSRFGLDEGSALEMVQAAAISESGSH